MRKEEHTCVAPLSRNVCPWCWLRAAQEGPDRRQRQHHARNVAPCRSFEPNSPDELDDKEVQRVQPTLIRAPTGPLSKVNTAYLSITGLMAALMLFKNPYIYAFLVIATVIPQNSNVTSLNTLVVWFYETGLFMNFAEAVTCVRLMTWLSISFCLLSFAVFT
jgi:hypothetical protein